MTSDEFEVLSSDLRRLAKLIPLQWGAIQNNQYDHLIDMFSCTDFNSLEEALSPFGDQIKQYFRRRWYMWRCAQCDEYLFYKNNNVESNPNPRDQGWDIRIDGRIYFDIKGTVVPRDMRGAVEDLINDPTPMIQFFYERQSRGVRYCYQNRLFVVHHSFVEQAREFYLRCAWGVKESAYADFCKNLTDVRIIPYKGCEAAVVFVIERERGKATYLIPRK